MSARPAAPTPRTTSRRRRRAAALLVLPAVWLAVATPGVPAAAADGGPTRVSAWTALNEVSTAATPTPEDAAAKFDVILAGPRQYAGSVPAMRAVNPAVQVFGYVNGAYALRGQATAFTPSWYLRDEQGNKVRSLNFGNYLMDLGNPLWAADRAKRCAEMLAASGYDGCGLDMLGDASLTTGYVTALPINPRSGQVWSAGEWYAAGRALTKIVRTAVAPRRVVVNGLESGDRYSDPDAPSSVLLDNADGGIAESWLRSPSAALSTHQPEALWLKDLAMVTDGLARGRTLLLMTKAWADGTAAEKQAWEDFSVASFLLVAGPGATLSFTRGPGGHTRRPAQFDVDLGAATASYNRSAAGVYTRAYPRGLVAVNPTGVKRKLVLDGSYRNRKGVDVTQVYLQPHAGVVLTRATASGS